jgi:hypothetical protein
MHFYLHLLFVFSGVLFALGALAWSHRRLAAGAGALCASCPRCRAELDVPPASLVLHPGLAGAAGGPDAARQEPRAALSDIFWLSVRTDPSRRRDCHLAAAPAAGKNRVVEYGTPRGGSGCAPRVWTALAFSVSLLRGQALELSQAQPCSSARALQRHESHEGSRDAYRFAVL